MKRSVYNLNRHPTTVHQGYFKHEHNVYMRLNLLLSSLDNLKHFTKQFLPESITHESKTSTFSYHRRCVARHVGHVDIPLAKVKWNETNTPFK
ncbi:CLUMA_CG008486, isoform A [Clunio marinus]|uniref:CLUMA_CG008486, isoform A n=1 Tax=Clunio marinus TaxID=568069 RepID=A0A1J1I3W7_9DIPT|nr:CLUMA_CG008486, isoform A [Clunio marinus]